MRPLIALSLPVILWGCLPSGDNGSPSGDATTATDARADASDAAACSSDFDCPDPLHVCEGGVCGARWCSLEDSDCGEGRGCYLPASSCVIAECLGSGSCVLRTDGRTSCIFNVCQPQP